MALQDQVSIRLERQILLEIARERQQRRLLAGEQAAGDRAVDSWLSSGEINAMQGKPLLKLRLFNSRLYRDLRGGMAFAAVAVTGRAIDGVSARRGAGGIELDAGARARNTATAGGVDRKSVV